MKKTFLFAIALPLAMTMVGCGNSTPKDNKDKEESPEVQQSTPEAVEAVEVVEEVKEPVFPWDFPEGNTNEGLEEGETIIADGGIYLSR